MDPGNPDPRPPRGQPAKSATPLLWIVLLVAAAALLVLAYNLIAGR